MAKKPYSWGEGATLDEHSKRKHKILREYFIQYLTTRCKNPQATKFRLAIIDGFCGAGRYKDGSLGSPLIFLEELKNTLEQINIGRAAEKMPSTEIECLLVFNDLDKGAVDQLRQNIAPLQAAIKDTCPKLHIQLEFYNDKFEEIYPAVKARIADAKYKSVLFNLDQCGYSYVNADIITDITSAWRSAEVFLTFPIETITAYISPDRTKNSVLNHDPKLLKQIYDVIKDGGAAISKAEWLGEVETIVFENLKRCAAYVSPFSINNPDGWRYWFIHFANNPRARQVYNDVLHANSGAQAHYGRAGLNMLSYDPQHEGQLYIFDQNSRDAAKRDLMDDIPKLIMQHGDTLSVENFYTDIYNGTAAHSDDIHEMIIKNPDIEVITQAGGERRKANTIKISDTLKLKGQKTFPLFNKLQPTGKKFRS